MAVVKDKKDTSVLIETQVPEYVTESHPKFKKFIEKYYEFMESQQVYFGNTFTFHEPKLQAEDQTGENYLAYENDERLQLESDRDTEGNANLQFTIGETLTGNTSEATAVVTGIKGNTVAFIKPTNSASFKYGEKVTGDSTRASATLSNGVVDGTFPKGSIESFRTRGADVAVKDLKPSQDIDLVNEGLIDQSWKKEFYVNIPKTAPTDRRQLLKHMKKVYKAKGNEDSVLWLFRTLFAKEDIEFYYPKVDLLKISDGKWILDKTIKVLTTTATNVSLFTGKKITGSISKCTALVEKQINYFAGALEITELTLSNIIPYIDNEGVAWNFIIDELVTSEADAKGKTATATTTGVVQNVTVDVGGTNYIPGNEVHITGGGGSGAQARVKSTIDGVVGGITIIDSGDGYSVGDPLNFINEETGGAGASGSVKSIIKTGEVLKNTDQLQQDVVSSFRLTTLDSSNFGQSLATHNANTHLYGNSSLIFSAAIKNDSGKYYNAASEYDNTKHILTGDRIAKQVRISTSGTQVFGRVTLANPLTDEQRLDVVGGKINYANSSTTLITGYTNNTVLTVKDEHSFGIAQNFTIDYASNTYWGTIISATSSEILYSVGSHYRDPDLDELTVQNFVNNDNIIVYDSKSTKLGANAVASGIDAHSMHNGVTFQVGNTPISNTTSSLHTGALNMTSVDIGAIDTFTIVSGGKDYKTIPPVSVANNYTPTLGNAIDVVGAPNSLLNLNLHSYDSGTISQNGDVITLVDGTFPDANSGVLTLTYANGETTQVNSVTNSSTLTVSTQKIFGIGLGSSPDKETYTLSYMAHANNFTKNSLLYNDDYSARGRVLDFIDKSSDNLKLSRIGSPTIANGNTTLRVDMTTAQDFGGVVENISLESSDQERILIEGNVTGGILIEDCVIFLILEDGELLINEDETRFYTEDTSGERITAHSNSVSTYTTGTIKQAGTTVTGTGTVFPNDFVRGTITYADDATSTITGYTNATSFTVADTKTIGSAQSYSISYNPISTWGSSRDITVSVGGIGNRTVTVTESGHYLRTGDKVKISGSQTGIFNGVYPITVTDLVDKFIVLEDGTQIQFEDSLGAILTETFDLPRNQALNTTYTYILPEDTTVSSPAGDLKSTPVASAWIDTANSAILDTSMKGNNAVIEVSSITIGAIKEVSIYNFGAGYSSSPVLSTSSGNQDATFNTSLGALSEYNGYSSGTTGIISGVPKIQDGRYYQTFSYVLKSDFDVNDYRDSIKRLTHPSGLIMFGEVAMRNKTDASLYNAGVNNVHDLKSLPAPYQTNSGRIYHNVTLFQNAYTMNVQFSTFGSNNEIEIYTARHPWQAMDGRLDTFADSAVNIQLEAYEDIDSIRRIDYNSFRIEHTLHGLEAGDVIEISGYHEGWGKNQITSQNWQGEHVITAVLTSNTYAISRTPDIGSEVNQLLYDGNLFVQLEDQTTGNNLVTEDYSVSTYIVLEDTNDNIILDDGRLSYPSTSNEGNILADAVEEFITTFIEIETFTSTTLHTVQAYDPANEAAPEIELELATVYPDITGNIMIEDGEVEIKLEDETGHILLEDGSGNVVAEWHSNLISEDYILVYDTMPGDNILLEGHGTSYLVAELASSVISRVPSETIASNKILMEPTDFLKVKTISYANTFRASATNWDDPYSGSLLGQEGELEYELLLEKGGSYFYPKLQFPEAETGTISIDMSFNSDILLEDDNGAYGWGYLLDETSAGMGNGPQRYISLEEDTEGIQEGHITQSIPYMETKTDIDLIVSAGYHLLTEDGDKIASEEHRYFYTVGLEDREQPVVNIVTFSILMENGDTLITEDGNKIIDQTTDVADGVRNSLLFENGDNIKYENDHFWVDPHEQYADITPPENILLEHDTWTIIHSAPVYQFIDYLNTLGRILTEDDHILTLESNHRHDIQEGHFSLERKDYFIDEHNEVQVEFHLHEGMSWHFITEDGDHFIEEGDDRNRLSRFVTDESKVKPSTRTIEYSTPHGTNTRRSPGNQKDEIFTVWKDTNIATVPYGAQIFRPHHVTQWDSIGLGFNDGKFVMEDNTGIILLEHRVTDQDKLIQEDFPAVLSDIMNPNLPRIDHILLEPAALTELGEYDHTNFDYIRTEDGQEGEQIILESSELGTATVPLDLYFEIELEDDSGYIELEAGIGNIITEEVVSEHYTGQLQSWTVLPAYQYSRIPTRLLGLIEIADGGTTVTGTEYTSFTTQLKVGEEFQTEDVTIIAEDSGGDVILETDERLEHEDITMGDVDAFVLDTSKNIRLQDFRWLITQENTTVAAHTYHSSGNDLSHTNVLGVYLEREMSLDGQDDSYLAVGQSSQGTNIGSGGNEESAWDTKNESYWFVTNESSDLVGIDLEDSSGVLLREVSEWENINMIWEDYSKMLIIEPQAFIVGSITNDQSMTVTRKHLGGVTEAEYRL